MSYLHPQSMYVSNECSGKYVLLDRLVWILVSQSVKRFLVKTSVLQRHLYYYYFFACYSSKCLVFLFRSVLLGVISSFSISYVLSVF